MATLVLLYLQNIMAVALLFLTLRVCVFVTFLKTLSMRNYRRGGRGRRSFSRRRRGGSSRSYYVARGGIRL